MTLLIVFDAASQTHALPKGSADLAWRSVLSTDGLSVFRDERSDYHVLHDDPEHLLLSVYPLLKADRNSLQALFSADSSEDALFKLSADRLPYPHCLIAINKRVKTVSLRNDPFGIARLYMHDDGGRVILSNRLAPIVMNSKAQCTVNYDGLHLFATVGWFMEESTPINEIKQLPPDTKVKIIAQNRTPNIAVLESRWFRSLFELTRARHRQELKEEAIRSMLDLIDRFSQETEGPIRASLSGGKDSRFIAALILSGGQEVEFSTVNYFSDETATVRSLLKGKESEAVSLQVQEPQNDEFLNEAEKMIVSLVGESDGMLNIRDVGRKTFSKSWSGEFRLSGLGGEMTHGFYYPSEISEATLESVKRHISKRKLMVLGSDNKHVKRLVREAVDRVADQWLKETREAGLEMDGFKFADYFYLSQRLRRKSRLGARLGMLAPMVNLNFVAHSFHVTGEESRAAGIQKEFIGEFDPAWVAIDFVDLNKKRALGAGSSKPKGQLTMKKNPLALVELCEDASVVREIWGRDWKRRILELSRTDTYRTNWMINAVIAVTHISRHFETMCREARLSSGSPWRWPRHGALRKSLWGLFGDSADAR